MLEKILEALKGLDPKNDEHWTEGKEPRVDAVKQLAEDQSITREQITAAEGFNRDTAVGYFMVAEKPWEKPAEPEVTDPEASQPEATPPASEPEATPPESDTDEDAEASEPAESPRAGGAAEGEDAAGAEGGPVDSDGEAEQPTVDERVAGSDEIEALEAELSEREATLASLRVARDKVNKAIEEETQAVDDLRGRLEKLNPPMTPQGTIQAYLDSQKRQLAERGARQAVLKEAGISLKDLAKAVDKAPIDKAMARKTARGGNRPSHPRRG